MKIYKGLISKATLETCFQEAKENRARYIGLKILTAGYPCSEVIINGADNFDRKLEYLRGAYGDDLKLMSAPTKVKIVAIAYGNSFSELARLMK